MATDAHERERIVPILKDLNRVYRIGLAAIHHGQATYAQTIRTIVANEVFLKIVRNLGSILLLSENCGHPNSKRYLPDAPSIACLARKLIETYETLFYLCLEPVSVSEREFRELAYSLHHVYERASVEASLRTKHPHDHNDIWEMVRVSDIHQLSSNSFFKSLSKRNQERILAGRAAFLRNGEIGRRCARDNWLRGAYKLFSNPVHGTSLGVAVAQNRGSGSLSFSDVIRLSLAVGTRFGALSVRGYLTVRTLVARAIAPADRQFVRKQSEKKFTL